MAGSFAVEHSNWQGQVVWKCLLDMMVCFVPAYFAVHFVMNESKSEGITKNLSTFARVVVTMKGVVSTYIIHVCL